MAIFVQYLEYMCAHTICLLNNLHLEYDSYVW